MSSQERAVVAEVARGAPGRKKRGFIERAQGATPLWLGLPALLLVVVTTGYPLVNQIIMSFQHFGLAQQFGQPAEWVWFDNYKLILTDPAFYGVLGRSIGFMIVCAAMTMIIGVAAAVLMEHIPTIPRVLLQSGMLLAWATPALSSLTVWQWLFNASNGVVNHVLVALGFTQWQGRSWFIDPVTFYLIAGIVVIWGAVPLVMFMVYASLTQVDKSMLEAAKVDGAGPWRRFVSITMPTIAPVLLLVSLLQVIWDLRVFTQIHVLQGAGGLASKTNVLGTYVYEIGLGQGEYGQGAAVSMVMLVLTAILAGIYLKLLLRNKT